MEIVSVMELHRCMGHIAPKAARKLVEAGLVTRLVLDLNLQEEHCEACLYACATRKPVPKVQISPQAKQYGDEIHTDIGGPTRVATCGGHRYFITFTDDATCYTLTYLLPVKSDALTLYQLFEAWALTQGHCTIKVL